MSEFTCIMAFNPHHNSIRGSSVIILILQTGKLRHGEINSSPRATQLVCEVTEMRFAPRQAGSRAHPLNPGKHPKE